MGNPSSIDELRELFLKLVNRFNEMEKIPYYSGTDTLLHFSEVHLIEAIGKNKDINITRLAKIQGVTKGAVSQMISRLVKKELVLKNISPETENEVVLQLTTKGQNVFEQHRQYHERLNQQLTGLLSEFPAEMVSYLRQLGIGMEKVLNDIIEERTASLKESGLDKAIRK